MPLLREVHAVVFDMDGLIFDTEPRYRENSHNGVRAASNASMMTIMAPDLLTATADMEKLCVCVAQDLLQVRILVKSLPLRGRSGGTT
jgi:beta-phosphoglucomutase-like phosphatase (HAD superfamily)